MCIYHVREQILRKKFEISGNLSLDAMEVSERRAPKLHLRSGAVTWGHAVSARGICLLLLSVSGGTCPRHFLRMRGQDGPGRRQLQEQPLPCVGRHPSMCTPLFLGSVCPVRVPDRAGSPPLCLHTSKGEETCPAHP